MLPTPATDHVSYERVYEPAEDSFLLLDTISGVAEKTFLHERFALHAAPSPVILEVGTGSGVVLAFVVAHSGSIVGRCDTLPIGVDINRFACLATTKTVSRAGKEQTIAGTTPSHLLGAIEGDLCSSIRDGAVDILIFNPPYVPTPTLPVMGDISDGSYERDSRLLELSYAGGQDGMETTDRLLEQLPRVLSPRGCAYVLLCAQNKPREVIAGISRWGSGWTVASVGTSGKQGGWEKLQILKIWRS